MYEYMHQLILLIRCWTMVIYSCNVHVQVQDTIPICTSQISQYAALGALSAGRKWVAEKVKTLDAGREAILNALSPLETTIGGTGAMYCMAKLPDGVDDMVRCIVNVVEIDSPPESIDMHVM